MTLLTIRIEKIGLKDAGQCIDPYITVSVKGEWLCALLLAGCLVGTGLRRLRQLTSVLSAVGWDLRGHRSLTEHSREIY